MKSINSDQTVLLASSEGQRAIATIAELARQRQRQRQRSAADCLVSWETISEFANFRITVRCDYDLERL